VQGEVLNLLNDLCERLGLAMVIITHNLHVVHHVADRTAVMYLGRFVDPGETEAMFAAPRHPYTAALLSANPEPDPDKAQNRISLPAEVPSLLSRPFAASSTRAAHRLRPHVLLSRSQPAMLPATSRLRRAPDLHPWKLRLDRSP